MKTHIWITFIGVAALDVSWLAFASVEAQGDKDEKITVRQLKFEPKDPKVIFSIGGKASATKLADAEAVEKLVGKQSAKALIDLVDFEKEMIVFVSWNTSGPPDGKLQHEAKGKGKDRKLTFYVTAPGKGERLRIGADFFAVPRGVTVMFDPKER